MTLPPFMTPEEFRAARAKLGLSAAQLAAILGTSGRVVRKQESGEQRPNPTYVRVVEWMLEGFRPPQWPEDRRAALISAARLDPQE